MPSYLKGLPTFDSNIIALQCQMAIEGIAVGHVGRRRCARHQGAERRNRRLDECRDGARLQQAAGAHGGAPQVVVVGDRRVQCWDGLPHDTEDRVRVLGRCAEATRELHGGFAQRRQCV